MYCTINDAMFMHVMPTLLKILYFPQVLGQSAFFILYLQNNIHFRFWWVHETPGKLQTSQYWFHSITTRNTGLEGLISLILIFEGILDRVRNYGPYPEYPESYISIDQVQSLVFFQILTFDIHASYAEKSRVKVVKRISFFLVVVSIIPIGIMYRPPTVVSHKC